MVKTCKKKVAVIGAGIAGALAANLLREKGLEVKVFEKSDYVGGKCLTRFINGEAYELGAVSLPIFHFNTLKLARKIKAPLMPRKRFGAFKTVEGKEKIVSIKEKYHIPWNFLKGTKEALHYVMEVAKFNRVTKGEFTNITKEYELPFSEWCQIKGFTLIPQWLDVLITSFGYGYVTDIKTWYVLHYINHWYMLNHWLVFVAGGKPGLRRFQLGYQSLVASLLQDIPVVLNAKNLSIKRNANVIAMQTEQQLEHFDFLVIACSLPGIIQQLDATPEEKKLSADIRYEPYRVVACNILGIPKGNILVRENIVNKNTGHVCLIENETQDGNLCVCYIPESQFDRSWDDTVAFLKNDVADLGGKIEKIHDQVIWNHFSQVNSGEFYRTLNQIQGQHHTFYVGGMCTFDFVESIVSSTEALIEKHFPESPRPREKFTTHKNLYYYFGWGMK